jgi:hypothetical protein
VSSYASCWGRLYGEQWAFGAFFGVEGRRDKRLLSWSLLLSALDVGEQRGDRLALAVGDFADGALRAYSDIRRPIADGFFRFRGFTEGN